MNGRFEVVMAVNMKKTVIFMKRK